MRLRSLIVVAGMLSLSFPLMGMKIGTNADKFEMLSGFKGVFNQSERAYKVSLPRSDVKVLVDYNTLSPFMGLISTIGFKAVDEEHYLAAGELVVFEDEVNPVISSLLGSNVEVKGLTTHFFHDKPSVHFLQFEASGKLKPLGESIQKTQDIIKNIRAAKPTVPKDFESKPYPETNTITSSALETVFGIRGLPYEGTVKFEFPLKGKLNGLEIGSAMGIGSWIAFAGSDENAVVDGNLIVGSPLLQPALQSLRKGNIDITSIYYTMTDDTPRLVSVHFWGRGTASALAVTLQEALKAAKPNDKKQEAPASMLKG